MRALILIHRYLGIAIGMVMAMWCVSGFVMMYVGFPALDNQQRLRALEPITWQECCAYDKVAAALGVDVVDTFYVEMVAGRPVLRVALSTGRGHAFDLRSGQHIEGVDQATAIKVAQRFVAALGIEAAPRYLGAIERDQWTVQGQLRRDRPLHHIALEDEAGTELYISGKTGQVVQHTTAHQRFWNWLGAVPHWLYPTILRDNAALWSQVVIWLSLAGVFLTLIGLYIGVAHWLAMKGKRWSPYQGVNLWHHLSGLFFGILTLTWVGSGLVSMNPWGFLSGEGAGREREAVRDAWVDGTQIATTLRAVATNSATDTTRIVSAPLAGQLYLMIYRGADAQRFDARTLAPTPLALAQVERTSNLLAGEHTARIDFLTEGDHYYYSGHDPVDLPVYRISLDDPEHTRYYINPLTGDLLGKVGSDERWYRWLFEGLHRFDFVAALRARPWWDIIVLTLMIGVTTVCCTGVYMGFKRVAPKRP